MEAIGDMPGPRLTLEQQQALGRLTEVRELLDEIDAAIDRKRCEELLAALELALMGGSEHV